MTSLITDFQLLESLHLRDFEALDRSEPAADENAPPGTAFPAAPRPRPDKEHGRLAAFAARVGLR